MRNYTHEITLQPSGEKVVHSRASPYPAFATKEENEEETEEVAKVDVNVGKNIKH